MAFRIPTRVSYSRPVPRIDPDELPSQMLGRFRAKNSDGGRQITESEARQVSALLRHYINSNRFTSLSSTEAKRETTALEDLARERIVFSPELPNFNMALAMSFSGQEVAAWAVGGTIFVYGWWMVKSAFCERSAGYWECLPFLESETADCECLNADTLDATEIRVFWNVLEVAVRVLMAMSENSSDDD